MIPKPGNRKLVTIWVVVGGFVVGASLLLVFYLVLGWKRPPQQPDGVVEVALTVVPVPSASPTPTLLLTPTPDAALVPTPLDGTFVLDSYVKVVGTGGAGLRLRVNPGLDYEPVYLGMEDEIFKVEAGPQLADGYTWWLLVAPFEPERQGWAVSNYLESVQEP